jgi:hypothetical protein
MRADKVGLYQSLPLRAHGMLSGVPLHDVWMMDLPGGRDGMTMAEINDAVGFAGEGEARVGPITRALFFLRTLVGRVLGWDEAPELAREVSYEARLTDEDRALSRTKPGTRHGIIRDLYLFEHEYAGEIINRTVHAFVVTASERIENGYRVFAGIYVERVSWFTPIYMAAITPVCAWIIYPSMRRAMRRRWLTNVGSSEGRPNVGPFESRLQAGSPKGR